MEPIKDAPKDGTPVFLAADGKVFDGLFYWSKPHSKWLTDVFTPTGIRRGYLDATPTHFAHVDA